MRNYLIQRLNQLENEIYASTSDYEIAELAVRYEAIKYRLSALED